MIPMTSTSYGGGLPPQLVQAALASYVSTSNSNPIRNMFTSDPYQNNFMTNGGSMPSSTTNHHYHYHPPPMRSPIDDFLLANSLSYKLNQQNQLLMSTPTKASNEAQKSPIEISAPIGTSVKVNTNSEETADQIQEKFEPLKNDLEESRNVVKEIESQVNQLKNDIITSSELEDLKSEILEAITIQQKEEQEKKEAEVKTEPPTVSPTIFPINVPIYTTTTTTPKPVRTLHQYYYKDFEPQASSPAIQVIQPPKYQATIINRPTKYKANRPSKHFKGFPTRFPLKQYWYRRKYRHICLFLFCMKDFKVHGKGHSSR